jgi:hypothetical protein
MKSAEALLKLNLLGSMSFVGLPTDNLRCPLVGTLIAGADRVR